MRVKCAKVRKRPRLCLEHLVDAGSSPNASLIRAGSRTIWPSALTHCAWLDSR